jgi:hypothetical protein
MTLISTTTLESTTAVIELASIPQTFTDLLILGSARSASTTTNLGEYDPMGYRFNGSTTSFSGRVLAGRGDIVETSSLTTITGSAGGTYGRMTQNGVNNSLSGTNIFSSFSWYIPNYSLAQNKSWSMDFVNERNATNAAQEIAAGLWSNTSAITSISLTLVVAGFVAGTRLSLYGITKGSDGIVTVS